MWLELHVTCFCEHGNEPAGCIECGKVLDYLRNYQLSKKTVLHGMLLGFASLFIYLFTCLVQSDGRSVSSSVNN